MSDGETMPYEGDHEDLKAARGMLFGLLIIVPFWLLIGYGIYWVLSR